MGVDVHQHMWTEPLVAALTQRNEVPFVRREGELAVLHLAGERPFVIEGAPEPLDPRVSLVHADGMRRALICLSSPLGIEALPRPEARELIEAHLNGVLGLPDEFATWGPLALDGADATDVDDLLARGCVGVSVPAGALAGDGLASLHGVLCRLEESEAPLFVHPGPGLSSRPEEACLRDPLWWPALTRYVFDMQAAWLRFRTLGRRAHPRLRVVFALLAGLAPLHDERLRARGGPAAIGDDPLTFFDSSSYGPRALAAMAASVGPGQLVYGSDRPVIDPLPSGRGPLTREALAANGERALAPQTALR